MEKNRFSLLLEQLVTIAKIKHSLLAQELRFDVSYISKWINGRVLPSEKNIDETVSRISKCLVKYACENGLKQLLQDYQVTREDELQAAIYQNLLAEYYYVIESQQDEGRILTQKVFFYPWLSMEEFLGKIHHPILRRVKNLDIMAAIDLFAIENEYRIQIVSQGFDSTAIGYEYPDVHFCLLIDHKKMEADVIRNTLFVSNMLRMLSHVDFRFYSGDFVSGKLIFLVKNELAVSGFLIRPDTCASVAVCEGSENTKPLYNCIQSFCTRETLLFQRMSIMDVLIRSTDYVHSLLASGRDWLLGHVTEHLLPADLFQDLASQSKLTAQAYSIDDMMRLHKLMENVLSNPAIRILVSESAVSKFVITGEVDFFTEILILDYDQRVRVLNYFLEKIRSVKAQIKVIRTPLMSDFAYNTIPSLFLSDSLSFLRLQSINQKENLLLKINRKEMQSIHRDFMDALWKEGQYIVSDPEVLEHFISQQLRGLQLLADAMGDQ